MLSLRRVFGHERQLAGDKGPFIIASIAGIGFAFQIPSFTTSPEQTRELLKWLERRFNKLMRLEKPFRTHTREF
jgi:hypothetical protein